MAERIGPQFGHYRLTRFLGKGSFGNVHLGEGRGMGWQMQDDILPVSSATMDDLDLDLFQRDYLPSALPLDVLEQNQRTIEQQLASLRFATVEPQPRPTVLGILVVGKDPRQFLPGDYIQFLRFDGTELTDPIKDQKEISGPLLDMLRILDETLQVNISVATDITAQLVEVRHPDYPIVALR